MHAVRTNRGAKRTRSAFGLGRLEHGNRPVILLDDDLNPGQHSREIAGGFSFAHVDSSYRFYYDRASSAYKLADDQGNLRFFQDLLRLVLAANPRFSRLGSLCSPAQWQIGQIDQA
jgi:hypothetical protein